MPHASRSPDAIRTLGHSNRGREELLELLREAGVRTLVDVRRKPGSRRFPWFGRRPLERALAEDGRGYVHLEALGGRRPDPGPEARAVAALEPPWRSYAAHMRTEPFLRGLEALERLAAEEGPVAVMCAERDPERCHRHMLSDALVQRGWRVEHLLRPGERRDHDPHPALRRDASGWPCYPAVQSELL